VVILKDSNTLRVETSEGQKFINYEQRLSPSARIRFGPRRLISEIRA